jgi:hypothetical protein
MDMIYMQKRSLRSFLKSVIMEVLIREWHCFSLLYSLLIYSLSALNIWFEWNVAYWASWLRINNMLIKELRGCVLPMPINIDNKQTEMLYATSGLECCELLV